MSAPSADPNRSTSSVGQGLASRPVQRYLLLAFCFWHAAFLIFSIIPREAGQDLPGALPADVYRLLTGSRQAWRLFHTIPFLRSLSAHVECTNADGAKHTAGFILPGFIDYLPSDDSRFNTLLERLLAHPVGEPYRKAYIQKINLLQNAELPLGKQRQWSLVFEGEAIRNLFYSRIDRKIALPFHKEFFGENPSGKQP